jgi:hypothetical protein
LLRAPILPTDSMPATATLSRVVYGRERRAELLLKGGGRRAIDIAENYQAGSPSATRNRRHAPRTCTKR